jgi:hypothetical protein
MGVETERKGRDIQRERVQGVYEFIEAYCKNRWTTSMYTVHNNMGLREEG